MPTDPVSITLRANGPLKVRGPVVVRRLDGEELANGEETALCRCGQSATKPFCDGTHKKSPFPAD